MADFIARCVGIEAGIPCIDVATIAEPVPLCTHHQMQVAMAVVPQMLASAASLAKRNPLPRVRDKALDRLVARSRLAPLDLTGVHGPRVYFLRNGDRIKIGYTTNLRDRLAALCLRADSVVLLLQGGRDLEGALHRYFSEHRTPGTEWFLYAERIHEYVENMASGRTPPDGSAARPLGYSSEEATSSVVGADFQSGPEGEAVVSRDALLRVIRAHMGVGRAVHLSHILRTLQDAGAPSYWTVSTLRHACEERSIPVRRQLKVGGQNRPGIHLDDLDAAVAQ
ncbi:GIY-YIG nuclease family protein [Streptomyces sp. NPDC087894]|uniref:GIY-YIG nuclease family protein n=1 Tax=Streptomyces sp. NPDC087894 TaxID=3365816 RepID=UPI003828494B